MTAEEIAAVVACRVAHPVRWEYHATDTPCTICAAGARGLAEAGLLRFEGVRTVRAKVDELSINFDDYTPEARRRYEGTHMFVGVHVPLELAPHLTCSTYVNVEIEVPA